MIAVRLNGNLPMLFGTARLQVRLPEPATVADLIAALGAQCPEARPSLARAIAVVGGEAASAVELLTDGQELALLMPVSGGSQHDEGGR